MLHNKGNTILIMAKTLVATPLVSPMRLRFDTMALHSILLTFKLLYKKFLNFTTNLLLLKAKI